MVKRADYTEASVPEYWIVDPDGETVTVLTLAGDAYVEHGVFARGDAATSALLYGVVVDVNSLFGEAEGGQAESKTRERRSRHRARRHCAGGVVVCRATLSEPRVLNWCLLRTCHCITMSRLDGRCSKKMDGRKRRTTWSRTRSSSSTSETSTAR